ncbi:MAG TPA: hypothetical protein VHX49_11370 [Candidatus Acidoferrales bacterium]|nr:hypothetical protein [Candidatus Acidoferrales bacterium]
MRALKGIITVVKIVGGSRRIAIFTSVIRKGIVAMLENSAAQKQLRASIFIFAISIFALAISAPRAAAQAGDGPQSGAAPSDAPASSPTSHSAPQIGGHPSLVGTWTLNKDQSDDPRQKMRDAMGGGGGGMNGGGGGGRQGMGGGMGGGRRGGGGQGGGMLADFSQLTIDQTATSAKVTGSSGRVLAIYSSDNSSQPSSSAANNSAPSDANSSNDSAGATGRGRESAPAPAQWQGTQFVATTQGRRGGSTTRTYELSPDGSQLYVTTKMDNPRFQQPVTFRLVYDAANSKSGASQ